MGHSTLDFQSDSLVLKTSPPVKHVGPSHCIEKMKCKDSQLFKPEYEPLIKSTFSVGPVDPIGPKIGS